VTIRLSLNSQECRNNRASQRITGRAGSVGDRWSMAGLWPQMAVVPWNLQVSDLAVRRGRPDRLPAAGSVSGPCTTCDPHITTTSRYGRCVWHRRWNGWRRQPRPSSTRMTRRTVRRCVDSRDDALRWPRRLADRTRGGQPSRPPALFSLRGNEL